MDPINYSVKEAVNAVKDPSTYSFITYLWVALLAAWGGVIRYLNSIKDKRIPLMKVVKELSLGASTSIFVGVLTFFLCEAANFQPLWTAVCVAVSGHMGAESLNMLRGIVRRKLGALSDDDPKAR